MKTSEGKASRALAAGLMVVSLAASVPAAADRGRAVPDAAALAAMREAAGRGGGVRVIGSFGQREIRHPVLDSTGVRSADWEAASAARPALFVTKDTPRPAAPAPIAWSEIEELKAGKQHTLRGAVVGATLGLAAALTAIGMSDGGDELGGYGVFVTSVAMGAVIGTFVGSLSGSKTIYRAQENH